VLSYWVAYPTWKAKKAALKLAITTALKLGKVRTKKLANGTFLPANEVAWENERSASRANGHVWVDLRLGSVVAAAQDETRYEYEESTDRLLATYGGARRFTVMVIIATDDQEDAEAVGELAGRLRTRIVRPDILEPLLAVNVGFVEVAAALNADYAEDGRMVSAAMLELRWETTEADEPDEDSSGDWVKLVDMEGDFYVELPTGQATVDVVVDVSGVVVP
jgi:hypothetical protein